jgi:hypothetical protein
MKNICKILFSLILIQVFFNCNSQKESSQATLTALLLALGGASSNKDTAITSDSDSESGQNAPSSDPVIPVVDETPTLPAPSSDVCVLGTNTFYVNGDSGSDTSDGSKSQPFQSIHKAMDTAEAGKAICVSTRESGNSYEEEASTLNMKSGVSIYGGYNSSWVRNEATNPTKWKTNRIGIMISNLNGDSEVSGFEITAKNPNSQNESSYAFLITSGTAKLTLKNMKVISGSVPGLQSTTPGSSIGILVSSLSKLEIVNSEIRSGTAGHGMDGENGQDGIAGRRGDNGLNGSCNGSMVGQGGNGGINPAVPSLNGSRGGNGGREGNNRGDNGSGTCPGVGGMGGSPGQAGLSPSCSVEDGVVGDQGGFPVNHFGGFTPYYSPSKGIDGGDGTNGTAGSGGGGGGGEGCTFCDNGTGNGGGGGGAAGSRATKGTAGIGGGSSVAIVLLNLDEVVLTNSTYHSGNAGKGGNGGNGGSGGEGGLGGSGAMNCTSEIGQGGNGAPGGKGGDGGDGSAGSGGPSIGIYFKTISSFNITGINVFSGKGGRGGDARNSASGYGGHSIGIYSELGVSIPTGGNQFELGTAGLPGNITGSGSNGENGLRKNASWD